jgi:nitrogen fixation protein FixH
MTAGRKWICAIVGLLAANVLATGVLIAAAHDPSHASQVIPAYYDRAVHYDEALDQAARNRALGWRVTVEVDRGALAIRALDRSGAALADARVHVTGYPRARADEVIDLELAAGAGRWVLPGRHRRGMYDLTVAVVRDRDVFVQRAAVEVP